MCGIIGISGQAGRLNLKYEELPAGSFCAGAGTGTGEMVFLEQKIDYLWEKSVDTPRRVYYNIAGMGRLCSIIAP